MPWNAGSGGNFSVKVTLSSFEDVYSIWFGIVALVSVILATHRAHLAGLQRGHESDACLGLAIHGYVGFQAGALSPLEDPCLQQ